MIRIQILSLMMSDVDIILTILRRARGVILKTIPSIRATGPIKDFFPAIYRRITSLRDVSLSRRDEINVSFGDGTRNGSIDLYSVYVPVHYIFPYCLKSFVCGPVDGFCSLLPPSPFPSGRAWIAPSLVHYTCSDN